MYRDLFNLLTNNPYPGRGIVLGLSPAGAARMAYFIMGRSENSRNRVFTEKEGGIVTEAADPAKLRDPSLIIYAPVRVLANQTIVTNGDQTDTIYEALAAGGTFEAALRSRVFEPDAPHYTPRISGLVTRADGGFRYKLSILKAGGPDTQSCRRFFFEYDEPSCEIGHFIHTYAGDGDPLPSFCGEPVEVALENGLDAWGAALWHSLNIQNKVALFVRELAPDGTAETRIYNQYARK